MTRLDPVPAGHATRIALLSLLLCLLAPLAHAQAKQEGSLPAWDQLSAAQREQLIGPLRERWNSQPQSRNRLMRNAMRWQQLSPQQRERARRGQERFENMSPEQRRQARDAYKRMKQLPEAERRKQREQLRQMTPEQQKKWLQDQGGRR